MINQVVFFNFNELVVLVETKVIPGFLQLTKNTNGPLAEGFSWMYNGHLNSLSYTGLPLFYGILGGNWIFRKKRPSCTWSCFRLLLDLILKSHTTLVPKLHFHILSCVVGSVSFGWGINAWQFPTHRTTVTVGFYPTPYASLRQKGRIIFSFIR